MLTSPAITEWTVESATLALFNEWLGKYFDGTSHTLGNVALNFPRAELRFQQSSLTQPLGSNSGLGITIVWVTRGRVELTWDWVQPPTLPPNPAPPKSRQQVAYAPGTHVMFFVRAAKPQTGTGNAAKLAQDAGQLLFGLLENSSTTFELSQKGIHKLRPSPPVLVSSGAGSVDNNDLNYSTRLVSCRMQLRYAVISQPLNQ